MPRSDSSPVAGDGAPNSAAPPPPSSAEEARQTDPQPRRSLRKRAERPTALHPVGPVLRVYERGSSFMKREHNAVEDLIDRFHGDAYVQVLCRDIRQAAAEHLKESVVDYGHGRQGRRYQAIRPILAGTAIAFYSGRLEKKGPASCNHLISIGTTELGYSLTVDGTPPPDGQLPPGSMQIVDHSCSPNCVTEPVETDSTLELVILRAARAIAVNEPISFAYGGSFWRPARELTGRVPPGQSLVQCACATPCPNNFARIERAPPSRPAQAPPTRAGPAERAQSSRAGPTRPPRARLTEQETPTRLRSEPPPSTSPARMATPEPDPPPAQVLPPRHELSPVRPPPPSPSSVRPSDEGLHGTIVTLNVGPVGLASSLPALAPILEMRPVAVLLQEAHVPAAQLQSMRALFHTHFPAYALFASRKTIAGGKIDVVTLVHVKMAARASLLDISQEADGQVPEVLARLHFVRIQDPDGQVAVLLGNLHQGQARDSVQQAAVLAVVKRVVARWAPHSHHVVLGGDWNASVAPRVGYAAETVTRGADARLGEWLQETGMHWVGPRTGEHTWTDGRRQAVLDAFVVGDPGSIGQPVSFESRDPKHDHRGVRIALLDDRVGPMPELEALRAPIRVKLEGLKDPEKRREYLARSEVEVEREQFRISTADPFERLERLKAVVLATAKGTLGTRGGRMKPFLPRHSPAFQRLAARIRLLRVVRRELWDRRATAQPASRVQGNAASVA